MADRQSLIPLAQQRESSGQGKQAKLPREILLIAHCIGHSIKLLLGGTE